MTARLKYAGRRVHTGAGTVNQLPKLTDEIAQWVLSYTDEDVCTSGRQRPTHHENAASDLAASSPEITQPGDAKNDSILASVATAVSDRGYQNTTVRLPRHVYERAKTVVLRSQASSFNEFVVQTSEDPHAINNRILEHRIVGGFPLKKFYPELGNAALWCCTEMTTRTAIDTAVGMVAESEGSAKPEADVEQVTR